MFPSHYLLITDLKFFADCQWLVSALVFHPSFFVDLGCIFDLVLLLFLANTFWSPLCFLLSITAPVSFFFTVSEFWSFDFCGLPCRVCSVFLSCILVTTLRSLIWDSLLVAGDSFFISLSSSTLVAFLTCFLLLSGQYVLVTALFHFVHKSSWLFLHYSLWVLKKFSPLSIILESLFCLFVMFSSHYLLITDFKLLAICPCLVPAFVFHQPLIFQMFFWNQMTLLKNLD